MARMQPSAPKDVLQGVHNSITDMVKEVANEPSVGLYFVQQHVHKAVPGLLGLKSQVTEGTHEVILYTEDVKDALTSVRVMKEVGPSVFSKMISTLNASLQLLPTLYHPKASSRPPPAYGHLPRSATHHGALAVPNLQQGAKGGVPLENSVRECREKSSGAFTPAEGLPAVSSRSLPSQDTASLTTSTGQTDASGYVSGFLNSAYQRASSVRMSMPVTFEAKERSAKQDNGTEASTTPNPLAKNASSPGSNSSYIPNIPYWNVFESAIQKAGHMVGAGSIGSGGVPISSQKSSLVRSVSASNLQESAHKKSSVPSVEASDSGVSSSRRLESNGNKQVHKFEEQRLPGSTESKLADWLRLPSSALRSLSRREGAETEGRGDELNSEALLEQEDLEEGDKEHPVLDLEDPQVVESYARLQAEQAAKLEAWLDDSKADETTPVLNS